jgi:hypothetical protein
LRTEERSDRPVGLGTAVEPWLGEGKPMSDLEPTRGETGAQPLDEETADSPTAPGGEAAAKSDPEELRRDIEQARAELGDTVEALSHKTDVKAQVSKKVEERTASLRARREELRRRVPAATTPSGRRRKAATARRTRTRTSSEAMEIPKEKILDLLKQRGENDKAEQADQELPDKVDPDRDRGILEKLGIDPQDLTGNLGGLGEKLGL